MEGKGTNSLSHISQEKKKSNSVVVPFRKQRSVVLAQLRGPALITAHRKVDRAISILFMKKEGHVLCKKKFCRQLLQCRI